MPDVVALTVGGDDDQILQTAARAGELVGASVRQVGIVPGVSVRQAAGQVLRTVNDPETVLAVLAGDQPSRSFWQRVVQECVKPVIVVPHGARGTRPAISRVLVPLDGTPESAAAIAVAIGRFADAGVDIVALHVFDEATVPRFWDQAAHAHRAWTEEFLARNRLPPGARVELRTGVAGEHVVDVAAEEHAGLIVLGWSRQLDPGRARTVRHTVLAAAVPVLLVPLAAADGDFGP
jgi:nucleotide-binding universal stress UspA family protein